MYHTRILMPNVMTPRIVSKTKQSIDPSADSKTEKIVYSYLLMHINTTYVQQTLYILVKILLQVLCLSQNNRIQDPTLSAVFLLYNISIQCIH